MAFEFDGKKYAHASSHQKEWGARLIEEFDLRGDERILDLGCGDGLLSARLAELVPRGSVLGIDASRGMIGTARTQEKPNLRFEVMDISEMEFEAEFDLVFSNAALHWVLNHRDLLARVHRGLRGGGIFRFNFAGEGNCANFFRVVRKTMAYPTFVDTFRNFSWPWYMPAPGEYAALLESFPFRDAGVWEENADRHFPDPEALVRWIDQPSIVPFLDYLPVEARQPFRDAVVQRMIAETRQSDGRCFETFRRINARGRKQTDDRL